MAQNKPVALVTGGARRVGRAIVEKLESAGFNVALTYFRAEVEANVLQEVTWNDKSQSYTTIKVLADLTEPDTFIDSIFNTVDRAFGRLDLLVHNASLYQPDPASFDSKFTRDLFRIHYESPLRLTKQFAPLLKAHHGSVVFLVDLLAEKPLPAYRTYCASKAAMANLLLSLARELAPEVRVNGIAPGVVEWPKDYPQAEREKYLKRVPLNRAGTAEEVANLVHFLATEGSYITGQIIRLDGGRSIT